MFNVFLILFAFVIQQTASLFGDFTLVESNAQGFVWLAPVLSLAVTLIFGLLGRSFCLVLRAKFARWPYRRDKYYVLSRRFGFFYKAALLAGYFAILVVCNWRGFAMRYADVFFVETLVELAPFFAMLVISWITYHGLDGIFTERRWTRRQYVDFQFRQISIIIVAMLGFSLVYEIVARMPIVNVFLTLYPEAMMLMFIPLMLVVYSLIPIMARFLWKVESLPQGPLRDRLEAIGRNNGVKVRDILLWHTSGGWIVNAAAIGIFPRLRYVVLTDGLVRSLTTEEVEAVYGHELGHAHYAHIAYYAAFLVTMSFLTMYIMGMDFLQVRSEIVQVLLQFLISFGLFIGVVFGFVSRRFEREADLFGSKVVGNTQVFIEALEKVSSHGGGMRKMPSWSHSSIERRVNFLYEAKVNPAKAREFERRSRAIRMTILIVGIICVLYSASRFVTIPRSERVMKHIGVYKALLAETQDAERRMELYAYIGDMAMQEGRDREAEMYLNAFYSQTDVAVKILREANPGESDAVLAAEIKAEALEYIEHGWIALGINALRCAREFDSGETAAASVASDLRDIAADKREAGEYAEAMSVLKGAAEFAPNSPGVLFDVGLVHYDLARKLIADNAESSGEAAKAVAHRKAMIRTELAQAANAFAQSQASGGNGRAALYIGRCNYLAGDWRRCVAGYRSYVGDLDESDAAFLHEARQKLAVALAANNPFELAVVNYAQLGRDEKHEPFVFRHFAEAEDLRSAGKLTEAIYEYEMAREGFADDNPVVLLRLAFALYERDGESARKSAEGLIDRAVRSKLAQGRYLLIAAWAMERIGLTERAAAYGQMAQGIPNQLPVYFQPPASFPRPQS